MAQNSPSTPASSRAPAGRRSREKSRYSRMPVRAKRARKAVPYRLVKDFRKNGSASNPAPEAMPPANGRDRFTISLSSFITPYLLAKIAILFYLCTDNTN